MIKKQCRICLEYKILKKYFKTDQYVENGIIWRHTKTCKRCTRAYIRWRYDRRMKNSLELDFEKWYDILYSERDAELVLSGYYVQV